jgi:O-phosphoseryl-tRNA(Cys) synthetase
MNSKHKYVKIAKGITQEKDPEIQEFSRLMEEILKEHNQNKDANRQEKQNGQIRHS